MHKRGREEKSEWGLFFGFLLFLAWQKWISGVFYMISVRFGAGVLLKTYRLAKESRMGWFGAGAKKNRKIFTKAFDKAKKCAIVYITRLIRSQLWVSREWSLREPMMDGVGSVEEVFFSKVSGKIISEIFEKSIDKHKIDAILNAPSFSSGLWRGCFWWASIDPEDSTEESGILPSRYKVNRWAWPGDFMYICAWMERLQDIVRFVLGGVLWKVLNSAMSPSQWFETHGFGREK